MKRYEPSSGIGIYNDPMMCESPNGDYVLASEAQAEIELLRGLVEAAYREGLFDGERQEDERIYSDDELWSISDARNSLTQPTAVCDQPHRKGQGIECQANPTHHNKPPEK